MRCDTIVRCESPSESIAHCRQCIGLIIDRNNHWFLFHGSVSFQSRLWLRLCSELTCGAAADAIAISQSRSAWFMTPTSCKRHQPIAVGLYCLASNCFFLGSSAGLTYVIANGPCS